MKGPGSGSTRGKFFSSGGGRGEAEGESATGRRRDKVREGGEGGGGGARGEGERGGRGGEGVEAKYWRGEEGEGGRSIIQGPTDPDPSKAV